MEDIDCYRVEMVQHPDGKMSKWEGEVPEDQLEELAQRYF